MSRFLKKRKRIQGKPPIAERHHWREEMRLQARHVHAGDAIILRKGRTRRFLTICEIHQNGEAIWIKWKDLKAPDGYDTKTFKARDRIEIRRTFHD